MPDTEFVAIHEYGIDPAALNSWERFSRFFIECCGYGEGRIISSLPSREGWANAVLEACQQNGMKPVKRQSVEERMRRGEDRFFDRELSIAPQEWLETALAAHDQDPLRLIVASTETDHPIVETPEELDSDGPWKATKEGPLERSVAAISQLCCKLLMQAKRIAMIDPYLDLQSPVFRTLAPLAWKGRAPSRFDLHVTNRSGEEGHISSSIASLVPAGEKVTVYVWRLESLQVDMDKVHDRFLLSELGGLSLGWGFGSGSGSVTHASLMGQDSARKWLARFRPGANHYELERPPLEVWGEAV